MTISQSGETADTLAAIKHLPEDYALAKLAICNVDHSAIVRASDLVFLTKAGPEIGVASTKAFTTQLAALMVLMAMRTISAANWVVNAFVEATPISGPALVRKTRSLARTIAL